MVFPALAVRIFQNELLSLRFYLVVVTYFRKRMCQDPQVPSVTELEYFYHLDKLPATSAPNAVTIDRFCHTR